MQEDYVFLVSLDELYEKEGYGEAQRKLVGKRFQGAPELVVQKGKEFISLAPYMNHTLKNLGSYKRHARRQKDSLVTMVYYETCRTLFGEWMALCSMVLHGFFPGREFTADEKALKGLYRLAADMRLLTEYYLDAHDKFLALSPFSKSILGKGKEKKPRKAR